MARLFGRSQRLLALALPGLVAAYAALSVLATNLGAAA